MRFMRTNCNVLTTWKFVLTASKDDEWWRMEWRWQVEVDRRATVGEKWHFSQSYSVSASSSIHDTRWISSSVSKQWPINLFFIFKKWTKLQRAKSDEWSRWWAKILLVWAKKKKNVLCFQLALSQHEMSFWQALQFRSFLLNALPQDITVKFDTGIPTLGDEFMVHSLMKTKGKKEKKTSILLISLLTWCAQSRFGNWSFTQNLS